MVTTYGSPDSFPIPKFWQQNFWEPSVQLALKDYCRPGDIAFDVGANAGSLSMIMSRYVGPRGIVCAFEASPRIVDKTHFNLISAGCSNVYLYHRAVYHTSHEIVKIYAGSHLNDSIYSQAPATETEFFEIETLALDDFVTASGLLPTLIKMDIEGAEFDALKGAASLIGISKPKLILEQSPSDMRCHDFLISAGYLAVDLANYRRVVSPSDFDPGIDIANILFIHQEQASMDPYANAGTPIDVAGLGAEAFDIAESGDINLRQRLVLPAGRYVFTADFDADGIDNEIFAGIDSSRGRLVRYHAYSKLIAGSYRHWVFSLPTECEISPYINFVRGQDNSLTWRGGKLQRFTSFDRLPPSVIY